MERPNHCHCVFPSASEETLATFEGDTPGTAIRVLVETGMDGYVRLQQMAYTDGMGWYVQKSLVIPGEMIRPMVSALRKADCLIPQTPSLTTGSLKLVQPDAEPVEVIAEHKSA